MLLSAIPERGDCMAELTDRQIRELLASRGQIGIIWSVEDVRAAMPGLSAEQGWAVLRQAEQRHDGDVGITWESLAATAGELFPKEVETGITAEERKTLFAEWKEDYAARRAEDAKPKPRLPSPSEIGRETRPSRPGNGPEKGKGKGNGR
jgi:hypothetical protein